jgi:hypothetical protein
VILGRLGRDVAIADAYPELVAHLVREKKPRPDQAERGSEPQRRSLNPEE